jgi:hypothetical protein
MNKKLRFLFCFSIALFQPELMLNNEQKADDIFFSPGIANANVSRWLDYFSLFKKFEIWFPISSIVKSTA